MTVESIDDLIMTSSPDRHYTQQESLIYTFLYRCGINFMSLNNKLQTISI